MPGVLLTEAMAQSSGWLLLAVTKFERMPFLAMVKEAKMRGFVSPGQLLTIEAKIEHEGSGFAVTSAKGRVGSELKCSAELTFRQIPFPDPVLACPHGRDGPQDRLSAAGNHAMTAPKEAWITGIGIVSSLGEGLDAHWDALNARRINVDEKRFAPYIVHPLAPVSFDAQIPKKGDQRQMEAWQRIGTYAAGLALNSAGVKGQQEILGRMDMIVAAGGGERDLAVDTAILNADAKGNSPPGFLNERLMNDLRPTLFLAQLSNLLAGNIAIVHGVSGTSRTFMGEEAASIDAARIALARIQSGQSDITLVGAAHNGERQDLLVLYEFGDFNLTDKYAPVWARSENSGFALGSAGVFLVIESPGARRGARRQAVCEADNVVADLAQRKQPGAMTKSLQSLWSKLGTLG